MSQANLNTNYSFMSKQAMSALKGYLAICVLLHHLYQFSGLFRNTYFGHFLQLLGSLSVACFFFLSGYGLYTSKKSKGNEYIDSFPRKKILPFYCTYLLFAFLYCFYFLYMNSAISLNLIIRTFTFGATTISFGWYLQYTYLIYIAFFLIYKIDYFKKHSTLCWIVFFFAFEYFLFLRGADSSAQLAPLLAFPLGLLWAKYSDRISAFVYRHVIITCLLSFILVVTGYFVYIFNNIMAKITLPAVTSFIVSIIMQLSTVVFAISFICLASKYFIWFIKNPVSEFLAKNSLCIYVAQGAVLGLTITYIANPYLVLLIGFSSTLIISVPLTAITVKLQKAISH